MICGSILHTNNIHKESTEEKLQLKLFTAEKQNKTKQNKQKQVMDGGETRPGKYNLYSWTQGESPQATGPSSTGSSSLITTSHWGWTRAPKPPDNGQFDNRGWSADLMQGHSGFDQDFDFSDSMIWTEDLFLTNQEWLWKDKPRQVWQVICTLCGVQMTCVQWVNKAVKLVLTLPRCLRHSVKSC